MRLSQLSNRLLLNRLRQPRQLYPLSLRRLKPRCSPGPRDVLKALRTVRRGLGDQTFASNPYPQERLQFPRLRQPHRQRLRLRLRESQ